MIIQFRIEIINLDFSYSFSILIIVVLRVSLWIIFVFLLLLLFRIIIVMVVRWFISMITLNRFLKVSKNRSNFIPGIFKEFSKKTFLFFFFLLSIFLFKTKLLYQTFFFEQFKLQVL